MKTGSTRTIGIEFECVSQHNHENIARELINAGVLVDTYATGHYRCPEHCYSGWQVKTDASIVGEPGYAVGVELASPPITLWRTARLRRVLELIRTHSKVNLSCGTHVHVSCPELFALWSSNRDDTHSLVQAEWDKVCNVLFSYVPLSRRYNQYAQAQLNLRDHRSALNMASGSTQTLEFRMHQGTLNARKIWAFASLCVAIVENLVEMVQAYAPPWGPLLGDIPFSRVSSVIEPTLSTNVPPKKLLLGRESFYIQRVDKKWILENKKSTVEYPDLLAAYHELKDKLRLGKDHLRAFKYPNHGNAMSKLSQILGLYPSQAGYLEHQYEKMLNKFGPYDPNALPSVTQMIMPDEVDFDDLNELEEEPMTDRGRTLDTEYRRRLY